MVLHISVILILNTYSEISLLMLFKNTVAQYIPGALLGFRVTLRVILISLCQTAPVVPADSRTTKSWIRAQIKGRENDCQAINSHSWCQHFVQPVLMWWEKRNIGLFHGPVGSHVPIPQYKYRGQETDK